MTRIVAALTLAAAVGGGCREPRPAPTAPRSGPGAAPASAPAPAAAATPLHASPAVGSVPASAPAGWPPLRRFSLTAPPTGGPEVIELPRVTILRREPVLGRGAEFMRGMPRLAIFPHDVAVNGRRIDRVPYPPDRSLDLRGAITAAVEAARGPEYVAWSRGSRAAGESPEHTRYPVELFADGGLPFGRVWGVLAATYHVAAATCADRIFLAAVQPSTLGGIGPHEVDLVEHLAFTCGGPDRPRRDIDVVDVHVTTTGIEIDRHAVVGSFEQTRLARTAAEARKRMAITRVPTAVAVRVAPDVPWYRVMQVVREFPVLDPRTMVYVGPE